MKKYVRERIKELMKLNDPPHKLALAFALGVFIAFSPTVGFHMISCLLFAWLFRLSKLVIITASFINNPWTLVPLYSFCLWFGVKITGSDATIPAIDWTELGVRNFLDVLKPFLWPFVVGTVVLGAAAAVIAYFLFYWAVLRYRNEERTN